MPQISVIMPAYNAAKTIDSAIGSVLKQTYKDFELIVIDDCSNDNTQELIKSYAESDDRIVLLQNEKNSGVSATRNYGISRAAGKWIAFLDSDDMWREDKLEKQLALLEKIEGAVISYTASAFIDENGNSFGYVMEAEEKTDFSTLLKRNLLSCSSVMIKADVMKALKMPGDQMHEDYYIWLKVLKEHKYAYGLNEPMLIYRLSSNSKSSGRLKSAKMTFNTYHAYGYCKLSALMLMLRYSIHSITKRKRISKSKI